MAWGDLITLGRLDQIKPVYDSIVSFFLKTRSLGDEILEERLAAQVSILAEWQNDKMKK